jgi:tRNA pseudouridine38-40 synthase
MNKYLITVSYDGTDYQGWQAQSTGPTIEQALIDSFKLIFKQGVTLLGASRTDAGVHAYGQVVRIKTPLNIKPEALLRGWNNRLPGDIVIRDAQIAPLFFHPHHNVLEKTYQYDLFLDRPLPHVQRYGWYYDYSIDLNKLNSALQVFVGTHDFRSFCTGYDMVSTVKTITSINVQYIGALNIYRITIKGPSFLRYMIRRIVGAAVEVASRPKLSMGILTNTLNAVDPHHSLPCAPAKGLTLVRIQFGEPTPAPFSFQE